MNRWKSDSISPANLDECGVAIRGHRWQWLSGAVLGERRSARPHRRPGSLVLQPPEVGQQERAMARCRVSADSDRLDVGHDAVELPSGVIEVSSVPATRR